MNEDDEKERAEVALSFFVVISYKTVCGKLCRITENISQSSAMIYIYDNLCYI